MIRLILLKGFVTTWRKAIEVSDKLSPTTWLVLLFVSILTFSMSVYLSLHIQKPDLASQGNSFKAIYVGTTEGRPLFTGLELNFRDAARLTYNTRAVSNDHTGSSIVSLTTPEISTVYAETPSNSTVFSFTATGSNFHH